MASKVENWRSRLHSHPIFSELKNTEHSPTQLKDSKRRLVINDGRIFVWNHENATVCTANIKAMLEEGVELHTFQTLLCSSPPLFDVDCLHLNASGTLLALVGRQGVEVLQLPTRWGKGGDYEGGKPRIMCKCRAVCERLFRCSSRLQVLQAAWHPGSDTDTQLVILASDNRLRLCNLLHDGEPEVTIALGDGADASLSTSSLSVLHALGHQAVAFDFGPCEEAPRSGWGQSAGGDAPPLGWPLYVLWANGDVYIVDTSARIVPGTRTPSVQGPLLMLPPAEDNYGTDACSLLCVKSQPPVLVIATPTGKLHHCVLLDRISEPSQDGSCSPPPPAEPTLYLYETVELELSLTTAPLGEDDAPPDDYACPIRLLADPGTAWRYHCSHSAGVHSVILPWALHLAAFCEQAAADTLEAPSDGHEAVVEHLICTQPLSSSPSSPPLGVCVTSDPLLGPTLLCLTSAWQCIALPLLSSCRAPPAPLLSSTVEAAVSPMRRLHSESFDTHIENILKKKCGNPLLVSAPGADLSASQSFRLLSRATQVFREEYIQKLDLARTEIQRRERVLGEQKAYQLSELQQCQAERNKLTQHAEDLAEKYEDVRDAQERLVARAAAVLKGLQSRLPLVSDAERQMHKELTVIEDDLATYRQAIEQLRLKREYQSREAKTSSSRSTPTRKELDGQDNIKEVLKNQAEQIGGLVNQLQGMKLQLHA